MLECLPCRKIEKLERLMFCQVNVLGALPKRISRSSSTPQHVTVSRRSVTWTSRSQPHIISRASHTPDFSVLPCSSLAIFRGVLPQPSQSATTRLSTHTTQSITEQPIHTQYLINTQIPRDNLQDHKLPFGSTISASGYSAGEPTQHTPVRAPDFQTHNQLTIYARSAPTQHDPSTIYSAAQGSEAREYTRPSFVYVVAIYLIVSLQPHLIQSSSRHFFLPLFGRLWHRLFSCACLQPCTYHRR